MKCSTCGSEWHLRRWCPRNRGGQDNGKGEKDKGISSGGPGVLYAQMHEGLGDMPGMPMQI
eukprot:5505897-Prorocentrum_lima.AAC.1